jgi:hypothetical protein
LRHFFVLMVATPKIVALDSSTWGNLARDCHENKDAREVLGILNSGDLFPFLTWHHFEELLQHANDAVCERRLDLIRSLNFVVYPKTAQGAVGSIVDLRDHEFSACLKDLTKTPAEVIAEVKPHVTNGFASGQHLHDTEGEFWEYYREFLADDSLKQKVSIASVTHFPVVNRDDKLPTSASNCRLRPIGEAKAHFQRMADKLAGDIDRAGDPRLEDGRSVAWQLMQEAFEEAKAVYTSRRNAAEALLEVYDVSMSRLPKNPRVYDMTYEAIFMQHIKQYCRRHLKTITSVFALEQKHVPYWTVWRHVDHVRKNVGRAAGSDLNDRYLVPFGLYVDGIEVDKRMKDAVKRARKDSHVFDIITHRILSHDRGKGYGGLVSALKNLAR